MTMAAHKNSLALCATYSCFLVCAKQTNTFVPQTRDRNTPSRLERFRCKKRNDSERSTPAKGLGAPWLTVEGRVTPEKDVGDDADAPHVNRSAVWCGLKDLWCDIYEDGGTKGRRNVGPNQQHQHLPIPRFTSPQQGVGLLVACRPAGLGKDTLAIYPTLPCFLRLLGTVKFHRRKKDGPATRRHTGKTSRLRRASKSMSCSKALGGSV